MEKDLNKVIKRMQIGAIMCLRNFFKNEGYINY